MTEAELLELHPPIRCGDGARCRPPNGGQAALLQPRLNEVGIPQSDGFRSGVVFHCPSCDWRRVEPLKRSDPCDGANAPG